MLANANRCNSRVVHVFILLGIVVLTRAAAAQLGGSFIRVGDMTTIRGAHTATLLEDGRVLLVGGLTMELYDPATRSFAAAGAISCGGPATVLRDGKVLIACGGRSQSQLYDPATSSVIATGAMIESQGGYTATLLLNGKVLITGGVRMDSGGHTDVATAGAELYDPETGSFSLTGNYVLKDFPFSFINPTANLLGDGRVLFTGVGAPEVYDPDSGMFSFTAGTVSEPAYLNLMHIVEWNAATSLKDGTVLISGGNDDGTCGGFRSAEIYDPSTDTFSFAGPMTTGRDIHSATLLDDGTVLVAGGGEGWCFMSTHDSAEIYDPAKRTFVAAGRMTESRSGHTATLLKDGTVLIAGGFSYWPHKELSSAELYQPATSPQTGRRKTRR